MSLQEGIGGIGFELKIYGGLDMWSFTGSAGDNVELRMGTIGFSRRIDLYGLDGTLLTNPRRGI
jgi:hypothetical protein